MYLPVFMPVGMFVIVCMIVPVYGIVMMGDLLRTSSEQLPDFMWCQKRDHFQPGLKFIGNIFKMMGIHYTGNHLLVYSQRDI